MCAYFKDKFTQIKYIIIREKFEDTEGVICDYQHGSSSHRHVTDTFMS